LTTHARLTVEPRPEAVAIARQFLRERSCPRNDPDVVDVAVLLVSELVTNAVRYGTAPAALEIDCDETHVLQVRVSDASRALPSLGDAGPDDEGGRGLAIVERLSDVWGVEAHVGGKTVWFRLASMRTSR
jgi:anti-sigma regulatory factor (Ser/Thr protein kinase)